MVEQLNRDNLSPIELAKLILTEESIKGEVIFNQAELGIRNFLEKKDQSYWDEFDQLSPRNREMLELERVALGGYSILATIRMSIEKELREKAEKESLNSQSF